MKATTKNLAFLWVGAVATATVWISSAALTSKPVALEWAASPAYPASMLLLAGSLALTASRIRSLTNSRGTVSLFKSGVVGLVVLALLVGIHSRSADVVQRLCFFAAISTVVAYVLLVILRGDDRLP